jgi:hypothetical protein
MDKADILQDISVELSKSIKKHLQHIKQLPSADKKQIEKLISNFKDGLDDLSEGTYESVNESSYRVVGTNKAGETIVNLVCRKTKKAYGLSTTRVAKSKRNITSLDKIVKESVNEAGIPKMYTKYRAVIKKIKELEDTQQKLAKTYFDARSKGDVATEKSQLELMKKNQKQLNAYRKNLTSIESDYINNMDYFPGE